MIKANIHEIKARLSSYVAMAESGEQVVICRRNLPVARICPVEAAEVRAPVLGSAKGEGRILPSFYEAVDNDELALWEGRIGREAR